MGGGMPGMGGPMPGMGGDDQAFNLSMPDIDLMVNLSDEELAELGLHLRWELDRYNEETSARRSNCEQWRRDFELVPVASSPRWPGASRISAPLTHIFCQNHTTRLGQQIVAASPPFTVRARKQAAIDAQHWIEEALVARLEEADWTSYAADIHKELPIVGNCGLRVTYEEEEIRVPRYVWEIDEDDWIALVGAGWDPTSAFFEVVHRDENGQPKTKLIWEDEVVHAGLSFKVITWEDMIVLPATVRDPKKARGIGERLMISGEELTQGAATGKYFKDAVEAVLDLPSELDRNSYRSERRDAQGLAPEPGNAWQRAGKPDKLFNEYLCYELCWRMDADGDGKSEVVIITFHYDTMRVLRCQYLPYEHGRPYYYLFRYFPRVNELFGMSVAEKLACIQDAATAVLNQLIDHADLVLNALGNFFYDGTAGLKPEKMKLKLNQPILVNSVEGVKPFPIAPLAPEHYNLWQLLKELGELVTATSNPGLGKVTDAEKTLGEVQIASAGANSQFEDCGAEVARQWADIWDLARYVEAQFGTNGQVSYRKAAMPGVMIQGEDHINQAQMPDFGMGAMAGVMPQFGAMGGATPAAMMQGQMVPAPGGFAFGSITAETLLQDVDLLPTALCQLSDMQARLQQASIVQNTLLTHPLTMENAPVLLIALEEFLRAVKHPQTDKIMGEIQKAMMAQMAVAQMDEMLGMAGAAGQPTPGEAAGPAQASQPALPNGASLPAAPPSGGPGMA